MEYSHSNQAYLLGNACHYEPFSHVYTFQCFIEELMQGILPHYKTWIVGQGLSQEERLVLKHLRAASRINFVMPEITQAAFGPEARTTLHRLQFIDRFHYQADVYYSNLHSPQKTADKLLPQWEVVGQDEQTTHRLSSDTSRLVDAIEALVVEGLDPAYPNGFITIKELKITQARKVFPLAVSLEIQLFKAAYANSYFHIFTGKGRFYQDAYCIAEALFRVEVESDDLIMAKDHLSAKKGFEE